MKVWPRPLHTFGTHSSASSAYTAFPRGRPGCCYDQDDTIHQRSTHQIQQQRGSRRPPIHFYSNGNQRQSAQRQASWQQGPQAPRLQRAWAGQKTSTSSHGRRAYNHHLHRCTANNPSPHRHTHGFIKPRSRDPAPMLQILQDLRRHTHRAANGAGSRRPSKPGILATSFLLGAIGE